MDLITKRFNDNPELETVADNDIFPLEKMETETDGKVTFETLNKQILHNANLEVSVDEENATLTVDLKDEKGEVISTKTVDLPNTGNIDCEVDEDTAELTVQLKNTKGEVVTSDTVQLPNTSNIDCEISDDMKLTVSLKNKSGQVVTSDTVQLQSALVPSITQSEYDELPEEEKTNGQIREITDAEGYPVPFAILNDELTTSANVLSAQETENRISSLQTYIKNQNILSDAERIGSGSYINGWTAQYDGFIYIFRNSGAGWEGSISDGTTSINIGNTILQGGSISESYPFKKGDVIYVSGNSNDGTIYVRQYKLRDYTGR